MRNNLKRLISGILCIALCFSLLSESLCVFADTWNYTSPEMIEYTVDWYNPSTVKSIIRGNNKLTFTVGLEGLSNTVKFSLSFPKEGGVRLCTDQEGYFSPSGVKKISYTQVSTKVYTLTVEDSTLSALFDYNSTPWSIQYFDSSNGKSYSVDATKIFFGFDSSNVMRKVKLQGALSSSEVVYGFGERYNSFNQVGKTVPLWNTDTGYHTRTENSAEKDYSYTNVPLMHSSAGYSLFFSSAFGGYADIGNTDSNIYSLEFNGTDFDYYMYLGTPLENIENYTALTGRPAASPEWAFSYWAGAKGSEWASGDGYEANVKAVLEKYKAMGTMPSAVYLESSADEEGNSLFNEGALEVANSYGVRALAWNNPSLTPLKPYAETTGNSLSAENLAILLPDVAAEDIPASFHNTWGDYSKSVLVTALKNGGYTKLLNNGLSGAMLDYGEYIAPDLNHKNTMVGAEIHNFYAYFYNKALSEVFSSERGDDYILFARAGCAGSQAFATSFGGDVNTSYDGLKASLLAGITISSSGFSTWGSDIGGHHLSADYGYKFTDELYQRWVQFSLFSPLMRLHGTLDKDPWNFGTQAQETFKTAYALRESLIDLLYSANITANTTGAPMMQVMAISFPEETQLAAIDNQYLFCNELLVCPVVSGGVTSREVSLPSGTWISLWDNNKVLYGGTHTVAAPVDQIPVFIREGAAIPVTLSEDYSIFEQPENEGYSALLITAPDSERTTSYETADGEKIGFTSVRNGNVCTITADSSCTRQTLVLTGVNAQSVIVDGTALAELFSKPEAQIGYYVDAANNRTIVNVGGNWNTIEFSDGYTNNFDNTSVKVAASDFAVYFSGEKYTAFVEEKADVHLTTSNGALTRLTDDGGYSDRDIDRNIVSAVLLTRKYDDFVLDATIKGTAGGASSLGFVIGQSDPAAHYMSSANGGYAVFFKRYGYEINLAIAYNGKSLLANGSTATFNLASFAGTVDDFVNRFGMSTSDPMNVRIMVENKTLKAYIFNPLTEEFVAIGDTIPLNNYTGGYIALAQSTAQTTSGAPADQYYDNLKIRSDSETVLTRSPEATQSFTSYTNTFNNSSISMLETDFDVYYAESQINSKEFVKQSIEQIVERLYINDGWLNRNYQGGNNWQPYLGNVLLQYKHRIFDDFKTSFNYRFLSGTTAKSTFLTVQLGQQKQGYSAYDTESGLGGYLVNLQLGNGLWANLSVIHKNSKIYTVAFGTEAALNARTETYDKRIIVEDFSAMIENSLSVEIKDNCLTVASNDVILISDLLLEEYKAGYLSFGFDIGNPDSGTAFNSISIEADKIPVKFEEIYGSSVTLKDVMGFEYSIDGVNYSESTSFGGLLHNQEYTFYHRLADDTEQTLASHSIIIKYLPGDFNGDNLHLSSDLIQLRRVLLNTATADSEICDVHTDGTVNILDLIGLKKLTAAQ